MEADCMNNVLDGIYLPKSNYKMVARPTKYKTRTKTATKKVTVKQREQNRAWDWYALLTFCTLVTIFYTFGGMFGSYGKCVVRNTVNDHLSNTKWHYMADVCEKPLLRVVVANAQEPTVAESATVEQVSAEIAPTATPTAKQTAHEWQAIINERAKHYGLTQYDADRAWAIVSKCENRALNPNATNTNNDGAKSTDHGASQINDYWHQVEFTNRYGSWQLVYDPYTNLDYMMWKRWRNGNFNIWTCDKLIDSNNERITK